MFRISRRAAVLLTVMLALVTVRGIASLHAAPVTAAAPGNDQPSDRWLAGLTAKHKQFFDAPAPGGGIPLVHVMNYYDTWNKAYNVKDKDVDAVLTFYGSTTFYGLDDVAWAVRFVQVETRGRVVLVPATWIECLDSNGWVLRLSVVGDQVFASPAYDGRTTPGPNVAERRYPGEGPA